MAACDVSLVQDGKGLPSVRASRSVAPVTSGTFTGAALEDLAIEPQGPAHRVGIDARAKLRAADDCRDRRHVGFDGG